jgi:diguanylate cyclase (GGDEF)-like protein/PAS domain S-box-containing protein
VHPFRSLSTKTVFFAALTSLLVIIVTLGIRVQREGARHLKEALLLSRADEMSRNLTEALFEIASERARCAIFLRADVPASKEDATYLRERLNRVKEMLRDYLSGVAGDSEGIAVLWKSLEAMTPQLEVQLVLPAEERDPIFEESWFRNTDLLTDRIGRELDRFAFLPGDGTGRYVPLALLRITAARFRNDTSRVASLMGRLLAERRPMTPRERETVIQAHDMEDRLFRNLRYLAARCAIDGLDGELDEIDRLYLLENRRLQDAIMKSPLLAGLSEEVYVTQTTSSLGAIRRVVESVDAVAGSHVRSLVEKERRALLLAHAMLVSLFVLALAISVLLLRRVATPMRLFAATIDRFRLRQLDEPVPPYPVRDEFGMLLGELEKFRLALKEREVLLRSVQDQEQWIRLITNSLPARISYIDRNLRFGYVNRTFEEHFRVAAEDVLGRTVREVLGDSIADMRAPWHECALLGEDVRFEEQNETDASESYSDIVFVPRHDESGAVVGFFSLALDITVRKRLEAKLREMADVDDLTGTLNRRALTERANVEIERYRRTGKAFAFLIMDIDFFKRVNDTYGHTAGDEALRSLAETCRKTIRPYDILGRFGGEEFVILTPDATETEGRSLAERLRLAVEHTPVPTAAGGEIRLTVSVGCTVVRQDDSLDDLLRRSDSALYESKNTGRNKVSFA